jgi:7-cyano-7-deazaguanine synthase
MDIVCLLSGGIDSSTLAYSLKSNGQLAATLSFAYGQQHRRELGAASYISVCLDVPHYVVEVDVGCLFIGSALTDKRVSVPAGHYAAPVMQKTVLHGRNVWFLAFACTAAACNGWDGVAIAAHSGDHYIYPDCRPEFLNAFRQTATLALGEWANVEILAPFADKSKADIVRLGDVLGVPFGYTWSCYKGGEFHCGECGTCVERQEAFRQAGVADPTVYDAPLLTGCAGRMVTPGKPDSNMRQKRTKAED